MDYTTFNLNSYTPEFKKALAKRVLDDSYKMVSFGFASFSDFVETASNNGEFSLLNSDDDKDIELNILYQGYYIILKIRKDKFIPIADTFGLK